MVNLNLKVYENKSIKSYFSLFVSLESTVKEYVEPLKSGNEKAKKRRCETRGF